VKGEPVIEVQEDTLYTEVPELAEELAKRVVGGVLKAARLFAPTQENLEGKKEHATLAVLDGVLYSGPELGPLVAAVSFDLVDLCKKKSPLREPLAQVGPRLCAAVNYGVHSPWLKLHEKSVRAAKFGARGAGLSVAAGIAELDLDLPPALRARAEALRESLAARTDDALLLGPEAALDLSVEDRDTVVVRVLADGRTETVDLLEPGAAVLAQARVKPAMFPKEPLSVRVYAGDETSRLMRFSCASGGMRVEQYLRVLQV